MNKRELVKKHLSELNLKELLNYRLLFSSSELKEDIELDITDLFKYPARLETSYVDNWQKDLLKALFHNIKGEFESSSQIDEKITDLIAQKVFTEKDKRTITLFENFLVSLQSSNVVLIHSSLHRKVDKLTF